MKCQSVKIRRNRGEGNAHFRWSEEEGRVVWGYILKAYIAGEGRKIFNTSGKKNCGSDTKRIGKEAW